tara:strand:+ start:157 stop:558 length:402 start_codon:yes stop_codon:yes gene_type:complete
MLTLFWVFFMSATFLIQVYVPDAPSTAFDASLELAAEDAIDISLATSSSQNFDSLLHEYLAQDEYDDACELILDNLIPAKQGNCWLSKDSAPSEPFSIVGTPSGETITVHRLLYTETVIWTVSIDVWNVGGGA